MQQMNCPLSANYHTHTWRCGHAFGEDRAFVEAAVGAGMQILGFSDHIPWDYGRPAPSRSRMALSDVEGYFTSLQQLREEYRGQLELHIGFEAEYFAGYFSKTMDFLRDYPVEYMILGQHFLDSDLESSYLGRPFTEAEKVTRYVDQAIEGMDTGYYCYLAHPDLPNFQGDRVFFLDEMARLLEAAKTHDMPVEFNILGYREGRHYPQADVYRLAEEIGNRLILGVDAHLPQHFSEPQVFANSVECAKKFKMEIVERPPL